VSGSPYSLQGGDAYGKSKAGFFATGGEEVGLISTAQNLKGG